MKRCFACWLALYLLLSAPCALAHESYILYFAESAPEDSAEAEIAYYFADRVLEYTDHSLAVEVCTDDELGSREECLADMMKKSERVNIMRLSAAELSEMGCEKNIVLSLPGAFETHEQFIQFTESAMGTELLEEPNARKLKLVGLGYMELGFQQTVLRDAAASLGDLSGRRVAMRGTPAMEEVYGGLGAVPESMPANLELALNSGAVDGAEQTLLEYCQSKLFHTAPYLIRDNHRMEVFQIVISSETWQILTRLERQCMYLAAKDTAAFSAKLMNNYEEKQLALLRENGYQVIDVTAEDVLSAGKEGIENAAGNQMQRYEQLHGE